MQKPTKIPGTTAPKAPRRSHKLKQIVAQAAASEAVVDLLREIARGRQAERLHTVIAQPRWASAFMEVV